MKKIHINVPHLSRPGGVSEIYRILDLENNGKARYFSIHSEVEDGGTVQTVLRLLSKYWEFWKKIKDADLVLLNPSMISKAYFRDGMFLLIAKLRRKPLFVFWHGWINEYEDQIIKSSPLKAFFKITYSRADGFVVLGNLFHQKLLNLGISPKVPVLKFKNVADDGFLNQRSALQKNGKCPRKLLFLSRIVAEKGIYIALEIFQKLQARFPERNLELIIAGSGQDLEAVKIFVHNNQINGITFTGFITGEAKDQVLKEADLFLFPTYYPEGLPLVILEALLYGLPVVTCPVGGLPDIIENGKNGYIVNSKNADDFIQPMISLLSNEELYNRISTYNQTYAKENFIKETASHSLLDFLINHTP